MAELKLGDKTIANIDELREHYSFSDIFEYFKSGKLVVWCEKNGYSDEAKAVESLAKDSPKSPHLKLYEIFNGADNTPQWLRDYFALYSKWEQKQDELSALMDKALPLYESLEKNGYAESEADKKERESLDDKISEMEFVANDVYFELNELLNNIPNDENDTKETLRSTRLSFGLMSLYMHTMQSYQIKRAKITEMQVSMTLKEFEEMSEEQRKTPLSEILKKDDI